MCANHADDLLIEFIDEVKVFGEHKLAVGRLNSLFIQELMSDKGNVLVELSNIPRM